MNIPSIIKWFSVLIFAGAMMACEPTALPSVPAEKVTLQLKWVHQAQFAGFYVASDLGLYQQRNLAVDFLPAGPKIVPLQALYEGRADFAITSAEDVVKARSEGKDVVAIAAVYRLNPHIFMTLAESGITDPRQFPGHSISYSSQDGVMQGNAMMKNLTLDINSLTEKKYDYKYQSFLKGEVDITTGYMTGGYLRLKKSGVKVNVIWPEDYGVHVYGDVLVTTGDVLANKPLLVKRFLQASFSGWTIALADQQQGVASTMKFALEADKELQQEMLSQSFPLIETGEDRLGWMEDSVWKQLIISMEEAGIISKDAIKDAVYDMAMLKQAYEPQP